MNFSLPPTGDWFTIVRKDMEELELDLYIGKISGLNQNNFKNIGGKHIRETAFNNLIDKKQQHMKMEDIHYNDPKIQTYFKHPEINKFEARNICTTYPTQKCQSDKIEN